MIRHERKRKIARSLRAFPVDDPADAESFRPDPLFGATLIIHDESGTYRQSDDPHVITLEMLLSIRPLLMSRSGDSWEGSDLMWSENDGPLAAVLADFKKDAEATLMFSTEADLQAFLAHPEVPEDVSRFIHGVRQSPASVDVLTIQEFEALVWQDCDVDFADSDRADDPETTVLRLLTAPASFKRKNALRSQIFVISPHAERGASIRGEYALFHTCRLNQTWDLLRKPDMDTENTLDVGDTYAEWDELYVVAPGLKSEGLTLFRPLHDTGAYVAGWLKDGEAHLEIEPPSSWKEGPANVIEIPSAYHSVLLEPAARECIPSRLLPLDVMAAGGHEDSRGTLVGSDV